MRRVCADAVGRLPVRQREVIEHVFFEGGEVVDLATRRGVARSTIDNHKAHALRNLRDDDVFFCGLCAPGKVRDSARARALKERYPDGVTPDGRRVVIIDEAAWSWVNWPPSSPS